MAQRPPRNSAGQVWQVPAVLAVATIAGLFLALTGDGGIDGIANLLLAVPAVLAATAMARGRS